MGTFDLGQRGATITVILDDIQWLDEGSAALFHFIARRGGTIRLACAARPGTVTARDGLSIDL